MNGIALYFMFCLGLIGGMIAFSDSETPMWLRVAGAVWVVVWAGPPLVALWIAGVSG